MAANDVFTYGDEDCNLSREIELVGETPTAAGTRFQAQVRILAGAVEAVLAFDSQPSAGQGAIYVFAGTTGTKWVFNLFRAQADMAVVPAFRIAPWRLRMIRPAGTVRDIVSDGTWTHSASLIF